MAKRKRAGLAGVTKAARAGFDILRAGGSALDAMKSAVIEMENNEVFNAGHGSTLTYRQAYRDECMQSSFRQFNTV